MDAEMSPRMFATMTTLLLQWCARRELGTLLRSSAAIFEGKNIDYTHASNIRRVLAIMISNLQAQAAAWYVTQQFSINTIDEPDAFHREFIQERLRGTLYTLKQREGSGLADYVTRHLNLFMNVKEMSGIDKITLFTRGLVSQTRSKVVYCRCSPVPDAISVAMEYERAHLPAITTPKPRW
ncbi:hypothetical protein PHMEG_0006943 [Phytophthora megakarya]|uniref:Retrotransposon gag domain-containing protein n=1 Tax=Phytophthora megakarya TaxID=4795 RepID=A0A225WMQ6_9STRA|nr:hypothetical protein PHMEG_0006943 [Phytophthora megakarya]